MARNTLEKARRFLLRLEEEQREELAAVVGHPFIRGVAEGTLPREALRRFAAAEYWYMRGGVKHFALSMLRASDLPTQRFFHERMSGELEYLRWFLPFAQALDFFEIPHVHGAAFVEAAAATVGRYAPTPEARERLRPVASLVLAYEREFYDALLEASD